MLLCKDYYHLLHGCLSPLAEQAVPGHTSRVADIYIVYIRTIRRLRFVYRCFSGIFLRGSRTKRRQRSNGSTSKRYFCTPRAAEKFLMHFEVLRDKFSFAQEGFLSVMNSTEFLKV